jgi:hypothetical protein
VTATSPSIGNGSASTYSMMNLLPKGPWQGRVRARALGATRALLNGASVDEVVSHGNWSSRAISDNFSRLSTDTSTKRHLSGAGDAESFRQYSGATISGSTQRSIMFLLAEVEDQTPIHIIRVVHAEIVHTHLPFSHQCSLMSI